MKNPRDGYCVRRTPSLEITKGWGDNSKYYHDHTIDVMNTVNNNWEGRWI